ncbi:MAG: pseudouridine synthase [Candidatus Competibacterales bacterium]
MDELSLPLLYRDDHYVAIHKPPHLLVHRTHLARDEVFVLQRLRDQLKRRLYPIHRLDRATSGVLVFGLTPEAAHRLVEQFADHLVEKEYWALSRGWVADTGTIDHPVRDDDTDKPPRDAVTHYRCLARGELPFAVDRYPTARYSWVRADPKTGRRQQIRRHFKHISHHLIGDVKHGNGKHNRFFRQHFGIQRLMLLAKRLAFTHPMTGAYTVLTTAPEGEWQRVAAALGWDLASPFPRPNCGDR